MCFPPPPNPTGAQLGNPRKRIQLRLNASCNCRTRAPHIYREPKRALEDRERRFALDAEKCSSTLWPTQKCVAGNPRFECAVAPCVFHLYLAAPVILQCLLSVTVTIIRCSFPRHGNGRQESRDRHKTTGCAVCQSEQGIPFIHCLQIDVCLFNLQPQESLVMLLLLFCFL